MALVRGFSLSELQFLTCNLGVITGPSHGIQGVNVSKVQNITEPQLLLFIFQTQSLNSENIETHGTKKN